MQTQRFRMIVSLALVITVALVCGPKPAEGAAVVRTEKRLYNAGEPITVLFSNSPGIDSDWLCIVPVGAPDTEAGDFQYLPRGATTGVIGFAPQPPGNYEVRAYYHYRQKGYVVTGRYPFSVSSVAVVVGEPAPGEVAPPAEQVVSDPGPPREDPPAIEYSTEPDLVVLPGTDVYAAPGVAVDIYFQSGWWWRPWGGYWYRSRYYDRGWAYYHGRPVWYVKIPPDWRHNYRNHTWGGHAWNPRLIPHRGIDRHWRDGRWRHDHGWAGQGRPAVRRDRPGDRRPGVRVDRPGDRKPGAGPARPAVKREVQPAARPGGPARPAVKGGGPGDGAAKPAVQGGGTRPARPGSTERPAVKGGGTRGGQPESGGGVSSDDRGAGRHGDGPGRGGEGGRRR
ncbi:MAG: hypothetical protein ACYC7J_16760 [Syntrophales bacterium]